MDILCFEQKSSIDTLYVVRVVQEDRLRVNSKVIREKNMWKESLLTQRSVFVHDNGIPQTTINSSRTNLS